MERGGSRTIDKERIGCFEHELYGLREFITTTSQGTEGEMHIITKAPQVASHTSKK